MYNLIRFVRIIFFSIVCIRCQQVDATPIQIEVRVDERVGDWCKRLEKRKLWGCTAIESVVKKNSFEQFPFLGAQDLGLRRLEGALRPGKYQIKKTSSVTKMLLVLLTRSAKQYKINDRHGLSINQQLILASIVEKEAASNTGYAQIARVFLNRLKKNQKLGSCPTVEYALGYHRPFLLFKDLEIKSPYNVYKYKGLPPTPIAFFSDAALDAVQHPAQGNNIFFVYDWTTGQLHFTPTYKIHKQNAARARQNFIAKYGREKMYLKFSDKFYEAIE